MSLWSGSETGFWVQWWPKSYGVCIRSLNQDNLMMYVMLLPALDLSRLLLVG